MQGPQAEVDNSRYTKLENSRNEIMFQTVSMITRQQTIKNNAHNCKLFIANGNHIESKY